MEIKSRLELVDLLKHFGLPMIGVEIGVCGGSNATDLLRVGMEKLYLVDNWGKIERSRGDGNYPDAWHNKNYKITLDLLSQFEPDRYVILKGLSMDMHHFIPDKSLGLVYIDADHSYPSVAQDIRNYYPKLVDGGVMGFHDYVNISGVRRAVKEFAREKGFEIHIIPETGDGDAGAWFRI